MQGHIFSDVAKLKARYGTSDPFELIEGRGIQLRFRNDIGRLKGFYTVQFREEFIVLNENMNERDQRDAAAHELGHAVYDRKAAQVAPLRDFMLYDMRSKMEYRANMFAAELLIEDAQIVEMVGEDLDYMSMCHALGCHPQLVCFKLYSMIQRGYNFSMPDSLRSDFLAR